MTLTAKFHPGRTLATPGALAALTATGVNPSRLLDRHITGDWGDLDADDKAANDSALRDESRIFSAYLLPDDVKVWIITEAVGDDGARASTCILLPDEY